MALSFAIGMASPLIQLLSALLGALIWLCPFWINPTPSVVPLLWGGVCLGLWAWLSRTARAPAPADCIDQDVHLGFIALLLGLGLLIAWRSPNLPNTLAAALCLAAIALATTIPSSLASLPSGWDADRAVRLIAAGWLMAALVNAALALWQYMGWATEPVGTAFGFLRQRNQMATLCGIGLLSLLYLSNLLTSRQEKLACHVAAWLLATAMAATSSRVGALQLGFIVVAALCRQKHRAMAISTLAAYAIAAWALPIIVSSGETVLGRLMGTMDASQGLTLRDTRRLLWDNTLDLIRLQPLLGVGWRELAYSLVMTDFAPSARFAAQADHSHNLPLQLMAELGAPAAALWMLALAVWVLWQQPWRCRRSESLMAWGVLIVIGIHSTLEYPLWYAPFQIATGLAVGIIVLKPTSNTVLANTANTPRWHASGSAGVAGLGLLAFCAYAAFDYFRVAQIFKPATERAGFYRENTLAKAEGSWLFAAQVRYARLTITPVTPDNATEMYELAQQVLHFSPEPSVLKILLQAGELLVQAQASNRSEIAKDLLRYEHQLRLIEAAARSG